MYLIRNKWQLLWLILWSTEVLALANDRSQPINIQADKATIDDTKGTAVYEGNVVVIQGSIRMSAQRVTLSYSESQNLDKVLAEGAPVEFQQTPESGKEDLHARAKRMEYFANKDTIELTQEAELWQEKDTFSGCHITYNTQTGIIQADKGECKEKRISVTIQPRPNKSDDNVEEKTPDTKGKNTKKP